VDAREQQGDEQRKAKKLQHLASRNFGILCPDEGRWAARACV
jgi:hypothetical protein